MATIGNKKNFSGMVGNVVFRNLNGKQIVQSRSANVKQTTATKKSASEFGSCSSWAKQLRMGLTPFLVGLTDSSIHQRFTTAIYNAIMNNTTLHVGERTPLNSEIESLKGFEFNTHSPFVNYFKSVITAELTTSKEVKVTIPAFNPKTEMVFPDDCTTAKLVTFVYATDFNDTSTPLVFHSIMPINKNNAIPSQGLLHTTSIPEGYFVLAAVKLLYYNPNLLTESNYLNTKEFSPAMVLLAETVGA